MSKLHINAVITQALLDDQFTADILNGHRGDRLSEFELTNDELSAILAIDAKDLDQFIRQVDTWMHSADYCAV